MAKASGITPVSVEVADILLGRYKKQRISQDVIAQRIGMSPVTLQKKIAGRAPITVTDLVLIAGAIPTDPGAVLNEAVTNLGGAEKLMSEARSTTDDLAEKRRQKEIATKTPAEIEELRERGATPSAAQGRDAETDTDESDPA